MEDNHRCRCNGDGCRCILSLIACVLKSGGDFNESHVYALQKMCSKYMPGERFVCLTDLKLDCDTIPLTEDWDGWWSKIELFKLDAAVYLDLDTILVGDCTEILEEARKHEFVIMRDVYRGKHSPMAMQSSFMCWTKSHKSIYLLFQQEKMRPEGDQEYIEHAMAGRPVTYWQDITDGVVSFKQDVLPNGLKDSDRVIIFHGRPRPWEQTKVAYETN